MHYADKYLQHSSIIWPAYSHMSVKLTKYVKSKRNRKENEIMCRCI